MAISDQIAATVPFGVKPNGFAGLGTFLPEGKRHVANGGLQINYFQSSDERNAGFARVIFRDIARPLSA